MATNLVYKYTESKTRVRTLAASVPGGTPLLDPSDSRPAVTITATGDYTVTVTDNLPYGWASVTGVAKGGAGLVGKEATLAYDGTWEFPVTGVTTSTVQGAQVYITSAGELTLTASTNTAYGRIDYPTDYEKAAAIAPVRIGN